nr:MAG TPA: restriction alleviation protein [Caudoviricetes sp.]
MEELKSCPFCGGKAEIREYGNGHNGNGVFVANYEVGCNECNIKFCFESRFFLENGQPTFIQNGYEKCVEAWNRREGTNVVEKKQTKKAVDE